MTSDKIDKQTLREKIYYKLREKIISGTILPGQAVTLKGLSEQFDVSIIPVREALFQLESEKVIVRRNNRDYRVNTLNLQQFNEIYTIRFLNEVYLARKAFRFLDDTVLRALHERLDALHTVISDPHKYVQENRNFHFYIYSCGRMPVLLEVISGLWARVGPYLSINSELEDLHASFKNHSEMLEAFSEGDEKGFTRILRKDIRYSFEMLKPLIERLENNPAEELKLILEEKKRG